MMGHLCPRSTQLFDRAIAFRVDCSHYFAARANCKQVKTLIALHPHVRQSLSLNCWMG